MYSNLVSPMELYTAARETCMRLYLANGGSPRDRWTIQPYPGTAAISAEIPYGSRHRKWTLCMPSMPLDKKVTRHVAELIAGYTVHELLHALWTDWNVVSQSKHMGLGMLFNAVEDTRIEGKASRGALKLVSEARRLLNLLNQHVYDQALAKPNFALSEERQFAFILTLVIFREKLGYTGTFPSDWRKRVSQRMLPLYDLALSRYDALTSSADALALARDLSAAAAALPPVQPNQPAQDGEGAEGEGAEGEGAEGEGAEGEGAESKSGDGEGAESEGAESEGAESEGAESGDGKGAESEGAESGDGEGAESESAESGEGDEAGDNGEAGQASQNAAEGDAGDAGDGDKGAGDKAAGEAPKPSESHAGEGGKGAGTQGGEVAPADVSDRGQDYSEVTLNDLGSKEARSECGHAALSINAAKPHGDFGNGRGNPTRAAAVISAPAKLKRHVTLAVKALSRSGYDRFKTSGRLDLNNLAGIALKREDVYKRRTEMPGKEAAVTLLIDASSSMSDGRIHAARAMAIHMGDALKAAGVKFEIASFKDSRGCAMAYQKEMHKPWNGEAREAVAGIAAQAGTSMLPAIKECAARLAATKHVTRRLLLVLTDGEDFYPPQANAANIRFWRARGVETFGLGLMLSQGDKLTITQSFDDRVTFVDDCAKLSEAGMAELVKLLNESERAL